MKKLLAIVMCFTLVLTGLAGCAAPETTPEGNQDTASETEVQQLNLKMSLQNAPDYTLHKVAVEFANIVSERTDGNITIDVVPGGALGTERENAEALKTGTLDLGIIAVEFYPTYVPESAVLCLPYMYSDYDHLDRVLKSDAAQAVSDLILEETDIRVLGYVSNAFRQMFTQEGPLNTVEDLAGVKMRVPESLIYVEGFKQMGASPTPVAWGDVYTALETGVVVGVENTPEGVLTNSLDEVVSYMNMTNHLCAPTTISISEQVYSSLTPENQVIFTEAAAEAAAYGHELVVSQDKDFIAQLSERIEVIDADMSSFAAKMDYSAIELISNEVGQELLAKVQSVE